MKRVSVSEARNRLCELIDGLASGPVTITNRGRVVAQLAPPPAAMTEAEEDAIEADLIRRGKLLPPKVWRTREEMRAMYAEPGIQLPDDAPSVVDLLIQERREGR